MKLHYLINGTGLFSIISTALAHSGSKMWLADLSTHLIPQHVFVQLLFLVYLLYKIDTCANKQKVLLVSSTLLALSANYQAMSPLYLSKPATQVQSNMEAYNHIDCTFTVLNLWSSNPYPDKIVSYLEKGNSDVLVLVEVTPQWNKILTGLNDIYDNRVVTVREDNFGLAVYSKYPILSKKIYETDKEKRPIIYCKIQLPDLKEMDVLAIHPTPPKHPRYFNLRTEYFKEVTRIINELRQNVSRRNDQRSIESHRPLAKREMIVAGDFNCPHWSPFFKTLIKETGLLDSGVGFGFSPTWPTYIPFLLEPIDHCLTSGNIRVSSRKTGPFLWSDHFPLELHMTISNHHLRNYAEKKQSKR